MRNIFSTIFTALLFAAAAHADLLDDLGEGAICFKDTATDIEYAVPSAKTDLAAVVTDGFVYGRVTQTFVNPLSSLLEATYVFPLPQNGAVHGMCVITEREVIWGEIKEKAEAQAIYDSAKAEGKSTALLVQNRPNIFTQNIANIAPGETVRVVISYSAPLEYLDGTYEMAFPTTVGPRFTPPGTSAKAAALAEPVYTPPGVRNGASLTVRVLMLAGYGTGAPVSPSHGITITPALSRLADIARLGMADGNDEGILDDARWVELTGGDEIPNKDFVLRFSRSTTGLDYSFTTYRNPLHSDTGYFAMTIFPDSADLELGNAPVELALIIDISGSTNGAPLAQEKELALALLDKLDAEDMLSVAAFNSSIRNCFSGAVPATAANISTARSFITGLYAGGGTYILPAVQNVLSPPVYAGMTKVAAFITDAYVSNEAQVLQEIENSTIQDLAFFAFGVGSSVNRYLIEEMGRVGNGHGEVLLLTEDNAAAVDRFWSMVRKPQLRDISVTFGSAEVSGLIPGQWPALFAGQPLTVFGKYAHPGLTTVQVTGTRAGSAYQQDIPVRFRSIAPINRSLPKIWARQRVRELQNDAANADEITALGLRYSIMTAYTSFVAVGEETVPGSLEVTQAEIAAMWPDGVNPFTAGGTFVDPPDEPEPDTDDGSTGSGWLTDIGPETFIPDAADVLSLTVLNAPVAGKLVVLFSVTDAVELSAVLLDAAGRRVKVLESNMTVNGLQRVEWALDGVLPGVYYLRVDAGEMTEIRRIVVVAGR